MMNVIKNLLKLRLFISHNSQYRMLNVLCVSFLSAILELISISLLIPFFSAISDQKRLIEYKPLAYLLKYIPAHNIVLVILIFFITSVLISTLIRSFGVSFSANVSYSLGSELQTKVLAASLDMPYEKFVLSNSGALISLIGKTNILVQSLISPFLQFINCFIITLIMVLGLIYLNPSIVIFTTIIISLSYLSISYFVKKKIRKHGLIASKKEDERMQFLGEAYGGFRDIVLNGSKKFYAEGFQRIDLELQMAKASIQYLGQCPRFFVEGCIMVLVIILSYYLSRDAENFSGMLPMLIVLTLGAQKILPLMQQMYQSSTSISSSQVILKDVIEILEAYGKKTNNGCDHKTIDMTSFEFEKCIELKNIYYKYPQSEDYVLKNVSLKIPKGSVVGVVGKSGSGKSTFLDLIMGLLPPTKGQILLDGKTLSKDQLSNFHRLIAHVPQNIFLADANIIENVTLGQKDEQINLLDFDDALRISQLNEFIFSLPEKLNTRVGDRGSMLSGGQRQRIGIARAIYKKAPLLFLDEATSALDIVTEGKVIESIREVSNETTIFMVSHRPSTLRNCDFILKVENKSLIVEKSSGYFS